MRGAGAWRTSWRRAAVRAAVAGMPNWRSAVHSVSAWRGWPARRPGNSHRLAGLVAVSVFCRLAAGGRVADPQEQLPVLADDVVDGQAHDAGDWLGEQEQAGPGPGAERDLIVGECPAEQVQAAGSGKDRAALRWPERGKSPAGHVAGLYRPGQEGVRGPPGAGPGGGMPGVDVGLGPPGDDLAAGVRAGDWPGGAVRVRHRPLG